MVLLYPRRGANVGAACRAIKNMGAGDLVVVRGEYDRDEAERTAVHAADVFRARIEAASFDDAVATASLVVGTTSRETPWSIPVAEIADVFAEARRRGLEAGQVALVFGPEDRGLSNEELARCHRLGFVPTAGEYASLNLAQAIVVCLYEWLQSSRRGEVPGPAGSAGAAAPAGTGGRETSAAPASAAQQEAAIADLRGALEEIGFLHGDQAERVMATVASIFTRSVLDEREVAILRGIARQVRWAARGGRVPG